MSQLITLTNNLQEGTKKNFKIIAVSNWKQVDETMKTKKQINSSLLR